MIIEDKEFGEVIVRKSPLARNIKFSISTSGRLQMSVPQYTSEFLAKRFLTSNRKMIRERLPVKDPREQRARDYQKKQLMKRAKEYLPYRLEYYAKLYGYTYDKCRLSHANTRWGSCSSNRTISLSPKVTFAANFILRYKRTILLSITDVGIGSDCVLMSKD